MTSTPITAYLHGGIADGGVLRIDPGYPDDFVLWITQGNSPPFRAPTSGQRYVRRLPVDPKAKAFFYDATDLLTFTRSGRKS